MRHLEAYESGGEKLYREVEARACPSGHFSIVERAVGVGGRRFPGHEALGLKATEPASPARAARLLSALAEGMGIGADPAGWDPERTAVSFVVSCGEGVSADPMWMKVKVESSTLMRPSGRWPDAEPAALIGSLREVDAKIHMARLESVHYASGTTLMRFRACTFIGGLNAKILSKYEDEQEEEEEEEEYEHIHGAIMYFLPDDWIHLMVFGQGPRHFMCDGDEGVRRCLADAGPKGDRKK
jgi:hypothetical protein